MRICNTINVLLYKFGQINGLIYFVTFYISAAVNYYQSLRRLLKHILLHNAVVYHTALFRQFSTAAKRLLGICTYSTVQYAHL